MLPHVTLTPGTGLPFTSVAITQTTPGTGAPTPANWLLPAAIARFEGPATAVALKVIGVSAPDVAVIELAPGVGPSVQLPSVAMPLESVNWVAPVMLPPPVTDPHVTLAPET